MAREKYSCAELIVPNCPFVNLPETRKARWGEALTAEKMRNVFGFNQN